MHYHADVLGEFLKEINPCAARMC